ncbi:AhpD family alkylhydroperoxidase [Salana multivorans]|uniref:AhpD family alkylhydroperoxidase n=1 Tax=Salana multivorans TaxID=120377 RepID=A0A3N2D9H0_9MICO|nr:carboxymuconolactone decarboxylase family protein [Salana multivorans]ROR96435.1 AhpD family alkylhydroperoxidase [Salana multivorans]
MSRVNIGEQHPAVYRELASLSRAAGEAAAAAGLDPRLVELVRLRVSQLNGCAFCCRLHTRDALRAGETTDRLAVLPAWRESGYFSDTERVALALAEEVTRPSTPTREDLGAETLSPQEVSAITWLAVVMNAWNRVAVSSGYAVVP